MGQPDTNANIKSETSIDPTLRALGTTGRYQVLQLIVIKLGYFGASFQLLNTVFTGRQVTSHQCSPYNSNTSSPDHGVDWNTSHVTYGKCEIIVSKDNQSTEYTCLYGYDYGYHRELSFRTEFDLVCDRKLLGGLVQSLVIMGQGLGALLTSMLSDRFGRKKVLVASQFGLFILGMAAGFAPQYAALASIKFFTGAVQQGVVATSAAMGIELFPAESRALNTLIGSVTWTTGACGMALMAFLLQHYTWRYLQFALSVVSLIGFFQLWYLEESLRWLINNGKKEAAIKVIKRAARANGKDLASVLQTLDRTAGKEGIYVIPNGDNPSKPSADDVEMTSPLPHEGQQDVYADTKTPSAPEAGDQLKNGPGVTEKTCQPSDDQVLRDAEKTVEKKQTRKMTLLDIFRHRRLLFNAGVMWFAWFTCAFSFFALYLMSTTLHGNRFLNNFLTALMEFPPGLIFFFMVDRVGRKNIIRPLYALAGFGLLSSGLLRHFADSSALLTLSVVTAMLGMVGASGMFGAVFFYTPELFPTNMRNQAIGISSLAGRCGGMLAPFMTDLADIAVWAPGVMIGTLCFCVVIALHFLPETKGRELPDTIEDIEGWYRDQGKKDTKTFEERYTPKPEGRF